MLNRAIGGAWGFAYGSPLRLRLLRAPRRGKVVTRAVYANGWPRTSLLCRKPR